MKVSEQDISSGKVVIIGPKRRSKQSSDPTATTASIKPEGGAANTDFIEVQDTENADDVPAVPAVLPSQEHGVHKKSSHCIIVFIIVDDYRRWMLINQMMIRAM